MSKLLMVGGVLWALSMSAGLAFGDDRVCFSERDGFATLADNLADAVVARLPQAPTVVDPGPAAPAFDLVRCHKIHRKAGRLVATCLVDFGAGK